MASENYKRLKALKGTYYELVRMHRQIGSSVRMDPDVPLLDEDSAGDFAFLLGLVDRLQRSLEEELASRARRVH